MSKKQKKKKQQCKSQCILTVIGVLGFQGLDRVDSKSEPNVFKMSVQTCYKEILTRYKRWLWRGRLEAGLITGELNLMKATAMVKVQLKSGRFQKISLSLPRREKGLHSLRTKLNFSLHILPHNV